jgi:hypothetical protein
MDIRGLLLVNSGNLREEDSAFLVSGPLGLLDIAGKSPLERMAERLLAYGITPVTAIVEGGTPALSSSSTASGLNCITATRERFWRAAENAFNDMAQDGAELVVLVRLGAYAELDFEKLVQVHLDRGSRVSQASHSDEKLDIFCISASRRNDAASLFRSQLSRCRSECPLIEFTGSYVNQLAAPRDLRQFAIDILTRRTQTSPAGDEIRPGVWMSGKAILERGARVLAPAYIGAYARVRTGAVITRCSSVEHHAQVDCGSVVENSSILPYCYVGAGLDLSHSVAGMRQVANLRRDVTVEVPDPKLIDLIAASSGKNLLHSAADLLTYLPRVAMQGIFSGGKQPQPDLNAALRKSSPALSGAAGYEAPACDSDAAEKFPNMIVARRYGHQ